MFSATRHRPVLDMRCEQKIRIIQLIVPLGSSLPSWVIITSRTNRRASAKPVCQPEPDHACSWLLKLENIKPVLSRDPPSLIYVKTVDSLAVASRSTKMWIPNGEQCRASALTMTKLLDNYYTKAGSELA